MQFMKSSLEKLAKNLSDNDFKYLTKEDGATSDKGEKLNCHISDKGYLTCKKIWDEFNMKNMGDYHDHYLKKDVLLLADVFKSLLELV